VTVVPDISIKKAALINAISKYLTIAFGIIFTGILSRILTPRDYGVAAIVTVFTAFFGMLADLGMGAAVIQNKTLTDNEINSIFSFTICIALGFAVVFSLSGFFIAWFYRDSVYIPIACILSVSVFFNTANMIPNAVLLKEKRFLLVGIRLIVITLCTYSLTIVFALFNFKYYALVIQSVLSALFIFLWNLKTAHLKMVFKIDFNSVKKIREYSGYQFGFNFINYFARNLDKLIIGKVMGDIPLAQYEKAYRMMLYPVHNLTNVITPVLHPILSRYQNNHEYIYQKYIRLVKFLSVVSVFITIVCFWCSKEIIILVFGNQWHEAVPVFKWLSLSIWAQMITGSSGTIFQSLGDTKHLFHVTIVNTIISCIAIIIGIFSGQLTKLALTITISYNFHFIFAFAVLLSIFKKNLLDFYNKFIPQLISGLIIFGGMTLISGFIETTNMIISLLIKFAIIALAYIILMMITRQIKYLKII
jgi:PST family polysaccharide transporter